MAIHKLIAGTVWIALASLATAADVVTDIGTLDASSAAKAFPAQRPYSPYAGRNFPTRPYFGDTHLHTSYSMDAGAFGARLDPRDAYRFAKGSEIAASSGQQVSFNIGVEVGQIAFIAAVLLLIASARRLPTPRPVLRYALPATVYGIGTCATYWLIDRLVGFWG